MAVTLMYKALSYIARVRHGAIFQASLMELSRGILCKQPVCLYRLERSVHSRRELFHTTLPSPCSVGLVSASRPHVCFGKHMTCRTCSSKSTQKDSEGSSDCTAKPAHTTKLKSVAETGDEPLTEDSPRFKTCQSGDSDNVKPDADHSSGLYKGPAEDHSSMLSPHENLAMTEIDKEHALSSETDSADISTFEDLPAPKPMEPSFNLAVYVKQSDVLEKLVGLGVDLSALEKVQEAAEAVLQYSWEKDIQPRLLFFKDVGVQDADLSRMLSKNPLLLMEDLEDLQVRVNYFKSKKFSTEDIGRIATSAPVTLLMPVTMVDKKLGFLQKTFGLSGDEVRTVVVRLPKIIPWKLQKLKDTRFYIKEMLGFSDGELKAILLAYPKVYLTDKHQLGKRFDFLHNVMGLTHKDLVLWPAVFRTRLHQLQQRHRFLLSVDRAQYDPTKENYVSLKALVSGRDRDFCFHVAKTSTTQFNNFLKAI